MKFAGKYQDKLEKEEQEIIAAKLEYDKARQQVDELKKELHDLEYRIIDLKDQEKTYQAEVKKREQMLLNKMDTEASELYKRLDQEHDFLNRQLIEINEAIRAANRAKSTAQNAMQHLDSAESWATYDVWFNGGILSHMAKYDHIDRAESDFNRLSSQLKELRKELSDININDTPGLINIDSTTRAIDFWFDNIFTDLKVRDKVRSNIDQIRSVYGNLTRVITDIENKKKEINHRIAKIEYLKNELILSL